MGDRKGISRETMKCIVTGGTGFVGKALAKALKARGDEVVALARRPAPDLQSIGIKTVEFDITSASQELPAILEGSDAVFHTAAHVKMWGAYEIFAEVNIEGTRSLLEAAKKSAVKRFIYTSSPSVIADGSNLRGVDETYPYPSRYLASYPKTKAAAEKLVLAANSKDFRTIALRPHLIFGPGDTNLIPTITSKAREGSLRIIGSGENIVDVTYIEDCVAAHLDAERSLAKDPSCGGRAYFISQGEPVKLWAWINKILNFQNLPPLKKKVPKSIAACAAFLTELLAGKNSEPKLTRFLVSEMGTDHYFSIEAARTKLGYTPMYSVDEALAKTFAK
jgi:nucleoside-diphosphate-sugar epimerase